MDSVQVPKIQLQQQPDLLPSILQSILWPQRYGAMQAALEHRLAGQEEGARQVDISNLRDMIQNNPDILSKLSAGAPPTGQGETPSPASMATGAPSSYIEQVLNQVLPAKQPYGSSHTAYENIRGELGLGGGKVRTGESFTGYTPEGGQQMTTVPLGAGSTVTRAPQVTPGVTAEGGKTLVPKVPGAVLSTPGGEAALAQAKTLPKETSVMGAYLPSDDPIRQRKDFDPNWPYQVMRDANGDILKTLGKGKGTFGMYGMRTFVDQTTGELKSVDAATGVDMLRREPGRYTDATAWTKAAKPQSLISDIRGAAANVKTAVNDPQMTDFTPDQRTQLQMAARALNADDPSSLNVLKNMVYGEFGRSLSPSQENYLVGVTQLLEQSMALRPVLGAGQSSLDLRAAIRSTIPSIYTFNSGYSNKQLNALSQTLNRLERGVPKATLRPASGPIEETPATQPAQFQPIPGESYADYLQRAKAAGVK